MTRADQVPRASSTIRNTTPREDHFFDVARHRGDAESGSERGPAADRFDVVVAERCDESHGYRQAGGAGQHAGSRLAECAAQGELGGGPPLQGSGDAAIDEVDGEDRQYYVCHPSQPPGAQPRGQAAGRQAQDPERHGDAAEV